MECAERNLLLEYCDSKMHAYTQASIRWQKLTSRDSTQEYRESRSARARAPIQVYLATYDLEQHERVHLCHPAMATSN